MSGHTPRDRSLFKTGEYLYELSPNQRDRRKEAAALHREKTLEESEDPEVVAVREPLRRVPPEWIKVRPRPTAADNKHYDREIVAVKSKGLDKVVFQAACIISTWYSGRSADIEVAFLGHPQNSLRSSVPLNCIFDIAAPKSITEIFDPEVVTKWFGISLLLGVQQGKSHLMLPVPLITAIASYAARMLLIPIQFSLSKLGRDTPLPTRLIQIAAMEAEWPHWRDWSQCTWTMQPRAFPTMREIVGFINSVIAPNFSFSYCDSEHAMLYCQHAVEVSFGGLDPLVLQKYYRACVSGELVLSSKISGLFSSYGVCFGPQATTVVRKDERNTTTQVCDLRIGDQVATGFAPSPFATVLCIWRCILTRPTPIYSLRGDEGTRLQITLDHPINTDGKWCLPSIRTLSSSSQAAPEKQHLFPGSSVYNVVLGGATKTMLVGGVKCCTLGMPVPNHRDSFWGTNKVIDWLQKLPTYPYVVSIKDKETGKN
ncbi:hypothetical protein Pelo_12217 [Pelomyxa schiedti]|nr:hypothetical protein Pelo_12217 [Pelomyxa schiedti]